DADAIVVTIPATAALSGKLADFMESDLKPFLHRCLSVVTRLDQLDTDDQHMVLDDLRERLSEVIGKQKINLYEAAPQIVVDSLDPAKVVPPHLQQWQTRFAELEKIIWDRLRYERTLSVSESLLRLMTQLLTLLEKHLSEREDSSRKRQQAIKNEIIPDLTRFTSDEVETITRVCSNATSEALRQAQRNIRRLRSSTASTIETHLDKASSGDEFKAVTEVYANRELTDARDELIRDFATTMNNASQQITTAMRQSEARFTAAYRRLESAGQISLSRDISANIPPFSVSVQDVLSNSAQITTNINGQEAALKGGGLLSGAALGTVLIPIPVLGTVLGGLLGWLFGSLFVSTNDKRKKIKEALLPEIDNFFDQQADALENSINTYNTRVNTHVKQQVQA